MSEVKELPPNVLSAIKHYFENRGYGNFTVKFESGSSKGDNYLGIITKVIIDVQKCGVQHAFEWIAKTATENKTTREKVLIRDIFLREIYMYEQVFPTFLKFQREFSINEIFDNMPRLKITISEQPEALLMENIKRHNYGLINRQKPIDLSHALLVLREYGRFHAISYALKSKQPNVFENLKRNLEDNFFQKLEPDLLITSNEERNVKALEAIRNSDRDTIEKFKKYKDNCYQLMLDSIRQGYADKNAVICHGDTWINNILFKYEDGKDLNKPTHVCFLDFQLSRVGSPATDLAYFIFACTDQNLRRRHYKDLLHAYHDSLTNFLRDFKLDEQDIISFEGLEEQMRLYSAYGLAMSLITINLMSLDNDEALDLQAMLDKNEFHVESRNDDLFQERTRGVIEDFVELGYI